MSKTPLAGKLKELIETHGPISVAEYMAHCLGDPEHGYYTTRDPFGAAGDFTTAPEVSQMFGEIVGAWLAHAWASCGAPSPVSLVELGPGRGTLMADMLRVMSRMPDLTGAATIHLVETSPVLRDAQRRALSGHDVQWHFSVTEVPPGALLLVANEFFDALPIRQFVRSEGVWRERAVGLIDGALAFGLGPSLLPEGPPAPDGAIIEISPAADGIIAEIALRIAEHGGAALVIDYGHAMSGPGETLQAVRRHAFSDPLEAPGEADLTAHVDFAALARSARAAGAAVHGPITQGDFLVSLGLLERAGRLGAAANEPERQDIRAAVERLAGPDQMGTLFKVMALSRPGVSLPPFAPIV